MIEREVTLQLDDPSASVRLPVSQFNTMLRFVFKIVLWRTAVGDSRRR